ncbi:MAG: glutamate--tRNA ligase family protein, partial [Planctomycetota bacterium]
MTSTPPTETKLPLPLVGRLAPSPTGAQHVGNARTYLLAWLSIRSRGGRIILRIEDLDSPRVKSWAVEQAIEDLRWLGLDWDEGPDFGGANSPYIQTARIEQYR